MSLELDGLPTESMEGFKGYDPGLFFFFFKDRLSETQKLTHYLGINWEKVRRKHFLMEWTLLGNK